MSFGRNQTGRQVGDRVAAQAFSNVEKDFERLELRVKALESFITIRLINLNKASSFNTRMICSIFVGAQVSQLK